MSDQTVRTYTLSTSVRCTAEEATRLKELLEVMVNAIVKGLADKENADPEPSA